MLGALYGDIVGSRFEFQNFGLKEFELFHEKCHYTDDSLMTLAVAKALFACKDSFLEYNKVLVKAMKTIAKTHPVVQWGERFHDWVFSKGKSRPMNSYGNGSAMRISPVGWVCDSLEDTIALSKKTTVVSHNHPEAIKGAEAVAVAIFLARTGSSKEEIKEKMISYYPELKEMTIQSLKDNKYGLVDVNMCITCQGSVPEAITCFLEGNSFEEVIRNAIFINGDSDTLACMAGSIAEAYYGLSTKEEEKVLSYFDDELKNIYKVFHTIQKKRVAR